MIFSLALKALYDIYKEPPRVKGAPVESADHARLRLLLLLQQSHLIELLKEDISGYTDKQLASMVRKIHEECHKGVEELTAPSVVKNKNK